MKKLVFILLLLFVTITKSQSNSEALKSPFSNELWSEDDKRVHFFASYVISATTYLYLSKKDLKYKHLSAFQKRSIVFATTMVLGLLKETIDSTQKNRIFHLPNSYERKHGIKRIINMVIL